MRMGPAEGEDAGEKATADGSDGERKRKGVLRDDEGAANVI